MAESEKSVTWIATAVMICIALFGWGFLAGSYSGAHEMHVGEMAPGGMRNIRIRGFAAIIAAVVAFVANSFRQLPNFFEVISWHFSNRVWLPIAIIAFEIATALGAIALKQLERSFERSKHRRY